MAALLSIISPAMSINGLLRNLSRNPRMRRVGRRLERAAKRALRGVLDVALPVPENQPPSAIGTPQRVLLVRPNFRIGNTLISAPLIDALHARFPGAQLDYLGADTTAVLLRRFPIHRVHCISRRFILRPWALLSLIRRIRREQYDVAVDAGMGSTSGGFYTFVTGARHRVGVAGAGQRFLTTRLPAPRVTHAYDAPVAFAAALGIDCADHPAYIVAPEERAAALAALGTAGLTTATGVTPFVVLSISGHKDKRLSVDLWTDLATRLDAAGGRVLILTGPEEVGLLSHLRRELPGAVVLPPLPLRQFAATLSLATLVVAPDSGPLHLSVAVGVPTIALLVAQASRRYAPRGPDDRVVFPATAAAAAAAVLEHPRWMAGA
ncbi:glycosyltransferase family 9 protein [Candidatus Binatia bacterium]|nr:glycosyltransferase family 9 protein [Candidatus Binatia bacterium]